MIDNDPVDFKNNFESNKREIEMRYELDFKNDAEIGPPNIHAAADAILCWRGDDKLSRHCISKISREDVVAAFQKYPELRYRVTAGPLANIAAEISADEAMQSLYDMGP